MSDEELVIVRKMRDRLLDAQVLPQDGWRWVMGELADCLSDLMLAARSAPEAAGPRCAKRHNPKGPVAVLRGRENIDGQ